MPNLRTSLVAEAQTLWLCRWKRVWNAWEGDGAPGLVQVNAEKRVWALRPVTAVEAPPGQQGLSGLRHLILGRMSALYFHFKYFL